MRGASESGETDKEPFYQPLVDYAGDTLAGRIVKSAYRGIKEAGEGLETMRQNNNFADIPDWKDPNAQPRQQASSDFDDVRTSGKPVPQAAAPVAPPPPPAKTQAQLDQEARDKWLAILQQRASQPMQNPYAGIAGRAESAVGAYDPTQIAGQQQNAYQMALAAAMGRGPSAAGIQAQQSADQISRMSLGSALSRGSVNPAAMRGAIMAGQQAQSAAAGQAAMARAQEQMAGQQFMGQMTGQMAGSQQAAMGNALQAQQMSGQFGAGQQSRSDELFRQAMAGALGYDQIALQSRGQDIQQNIAGQQMASQNDAANKAMWSTILAKMLS
jgi:hypothetical protein